ncbi:MAG: prolyl oligopeptidase family serine peptidase [Myxococcota bacterium]|nr:prolyl oligopeptidase family serine peptidase [Myxococcota bacterium]
MQYPRVLVLVVLLAMGCGEAPSTTAPTLDAAAAADAASPPGEPRCASTTTMITCTSRATEIGGRTVTYELPAGTPPAAGWPTVIYFQGSLVAGSRAFAAARTDPFGQYELTRTIAALLDRGYAVVAPDARDGGNSYWQTNIPPYATAWSGSEDDVFVRRLFATIDAGELGPLDAARLAAMGISSGGFMTSRMAVSYAGRFRALAIHSGSYATCGLVCSVPDLPADHPPTVFLHGSADLTVRPSVMTPYRDQLVAGGHTVDTVLREGAGHEWISEGVTVIPAWFDEHL